MKTVKAEQVETGSTSFINIVGGLLIAFAVIDFAMSFAGTNLTSFLGPISRFSPIIFGLNLYIPDRMTYIYLLF